MCDYIDVPLPLFNEAAAAAVPTARRAAIRDLRRHVERYQDQIAARRAEARLGPARKAGNAQAAAFGGELDAMYGLADEIIRQLHEMEARLTKGHTS